MAPDGKFRSWVARLTMTARLESHVFLCGFRFRMSLVGTKRTSSDVRSSVAREDMWTRIAVQQFQRVSPVRKLGANRCRCRLMARPIGFLGHFSLVARSQSARLRYCTRRGPYGDT